MFRVFDQSNSSSQAHWPALMAWALMLLTVIAAGPGYFAYALVHALHGELPAHRSGPPPGLVGSVGLRDVTAHQKAVSTAGSTNSEIAVEQLGLIEEDPFKAYLKLRRTTEAVDTRTAMNLPDRLAGYRPKTYRTVCVRLCDGYYFPISYSTTVDHFADQEKLCQSRCESPVRLYVYPNRGGTPDQMRDLSGNPYLNLQTAFRFHVEFDSACSCQPQPWSIAAKRRHRLYAQAAKQSKARS